MDIYRKRALHDYEDSVGFLRESDLFLYPKRNWIKRIRSAIGMTVNQLAARLGITPARVRIIEKTEVSGHLKIETLERVAEALNCKLVYAFVSKDDLYQMLEKQAHVKAEKIVSVTTHTMGLEDQATNPSNQKLILEDLKEKFLRDPKKEGLWDE